MVKVRQLTPGALVKVKQAICCYDSCVGPLGRETVISWKLPGALAVVIGICDSDLTHKKLCLLSQGRVVYSYVKMFEHPLEVL